MKLNQRFGDLFDKIIKNKKQRKKLLNNIEKLYNKNIISQDLVLVLIKSLILVLSYLPKKIFLINKIIKEFANCNNEIKEDLINILNNYNFNQLTLSDYLIEKIIFNTIVLFQLIEKTFFPQLYTIWYQIILCINKIKKKNTILKAHIYINIVKESINIIKKERAHSYLKIIKMCNKTRELINSYLN